MFNSRSVTYGFPLGHTFHAVRSPHLLGSCFAQCRREQTQHPRRFRQAIQEYYILPSALDVRFAGSALVAFALPLAEQSAGLGLITGMWLIPSLFLALSLFVLFSGAILINLHRLFKMCIILSYKLLITGLYDTLNNDTCCFS